MSKVISRLLWFCFTVLYHRLEKFAPFFQPKRNQAKTNRDVFARVFPRLTRPLTCICFEFWLVHCAVDVCCSYPFSRAWCRLHVFASNSDRVDCAGYVCCSYAFSRVWCRLHVFALNSDWFIVLFTSGARTRFPALDTAYMYLLRILIGSLCCLRLLLVRVFPRLMPLTCICFEFIIGSLCCLRLVLVPVSPPLDAAYMYLLRILIGSLCCLRLLLVCVFQRFCDLGVFASSSNLFLSPSVIG